MEIGVFIVLAAAGAADVATWPCTEPGAVIGAVTGAVRVTGAAVATGAAVTDGVVCVVTAGAAGSLPSSTPACSGVGAPRKPPLLTGFVLSSPFSVELLIMRTLSGAGCGCDAPLPFKSGSAGRA